MRQYLSELAEMPARLRPELRYRSFYYDQPTDFRVRVEGGPPVELCIFVLEELVKPKARRTITGQPEDDGPLRLRLADIGQWEPAGIYRQPGVDFVRFEKSEWLQRKLRAR